MKIVLSLSALLLSAAALATTTPTMAPPASPGAPRLLKAGESYLLAACEQVSEGNAISDINRILASGTIIASGVEIDQPYSVSAPSYSGVGNPQIGYSWCAAVTVTKQ